MGVCGKRNELLSFFMNMEEKGKALFVIDLARGESITEEE